MPDELNIEELTEARRKAIAASIHPIAVEEVKTLVEALYPNVMHPWRDKVLDFVTANSAATFHHATTDDRVHILYCGEKERGMWFLPGVASGPLQAKGLGILKEIVANNR